MSAPAAGDAPPALLRSQARARALLDAIPDLMFRIGADGTYRELKAEDPGELTADADSLLGRNVAEVLPADVVSRLMDAARRAIETREVQEVEYRLTVVTGEERDFEGRLVASGDDEFVLIVRDITERKRQEEELQRLSAELSARVEDIERERDFTRAVVNATPSYLCLCDAQGRIVRYNATLELTSGRRDVGDEVRGKHAWDVFVVPEQRADARAAFAAIVDARDPVRREYTLPCADGSERIVDWIGTPVVDERGESRYLLSGVDVTIRKEQEEELRRSRARIVDAADAERRRLERNLHDGAQQQLVFVSHALRLAARALRDDPEKARGLVERAVDAVTTAHGELRELARGLHPALLTARGLVAAVQALGVRSTVPVEVVADERDRRYPGRIETAAYFVVSEALANVAKYAQATRVTVTIERRGDELAVEVADDGRGGADPAAGSGLRGLSDRLAALDGRLEVHSPAGGGTTLRALLPLRDG
ncbi:MAG TPA: PAS domain-containing protein [Gaiellaceae bacterium]|nr:PAS domain-containing protein [Gaiellaceae bacterium]